MWGHRLHQHLYLRIWLALVGVVVVLTLLVSWIWRMQVEHERAQRPGREIVLRDDTGSVIGQATVRPVRVPGQGLEYQVGLVDGRQLFIQLPRPQRPHGNGVAMVWHPPLGVVGFLGLLALAAAAVALAAYSVVRRLTQRLERLRQGVERWGDGDLSTRLPVQGHDEIAFLAERFNASAERVESLLLAHKALLANASHELRSPLARIRMGLELLGRQGDDAAVQREEIARNIAELDQLIDEILLASRLDQTAVGQEGALGPWEEVDLVGLAAEECARTGATLACEGEPAAFLVRGQPRLLRRLVRNLLENARRHGLRDGDPASVTLTLRRRPGAAPAGSGVELRVCDHGAGVPEALRERIFEPFYRLPGASEREGGVGLGLSLVRLIARRHGGEVHCEGRQGQKGACFVVFLPI
jgi:two-component system, OmpR family, sensor kinase